MIRVTFPKFQICFETFEIEQLPADVTNLFYAVQCAACRPIWSWSSKPKVTQGNICCRIFETKQNKLKTHQHCKYWLSFAVYFFVVEMIYMILTPFSFFFKAFSLIIQPEIWKDIHKKCYSSCFLDRILAQHENRKIFESFGKTAKDSWSRRFLGQNKYFYGKYIWDLSFEIQTAMENL